MNYAFGVHLRLGLLCVVVSLACVSFALAQSRDNPSPNKPETNAEFPPLPSSLGPIPGFDDEAAWQRSVAKAVDESVERATNAVMPTEKADHLLSAVSLILGQQLEPACTRSLLDLPAADNAHPEESRSLLVRAEKLITQAADALTGEDSQLGEREVAPNNAPTRRLDVLRSFFRAIQAFLADPGDSATASDRRRAASALAPLLEDGDKRIAASARLWQAALRSTEDDPAAALYILEPVLADLAADTLPYSFHARLLRCRLIGDRGSFAEALAFLTLIEDRLDDWFTDAADRDRAIRTVALVKAGVMHKWYSRLSPGDHADERAWCVNEARKIVDHYLSGNAPILRLLPAVPTVDDPAPPEPTKTDTDRDSPDPAEPE